MVCTMRTYDRIWRKREFLPCWVVQCICVGILGVVACLLIGASAVVLTAGHGINDYTWLGFSVDEGAKTSIILGSVLLAFCIITLALDITEAILYRRHRLSPAIVLTSACIKTVMWLTYFVAVVVVAARGSPSPLDLILGIILVTTSISQIFIGAVYTHKQRKGLLSRGNYADLELGGNTESTASIPRSKSWRKSIPAITINSREWSRSSNEGIGYEKFRTSLIEAESRRQSRLELDAAEPAAETQTLASSDYDASTMWQTSPPSSPSLMTILSHPPVHRVYSPANSTYDFDQADLALTGFYGGGVEGATKG